MLLVQSFRQCSRCLGTGVDTNSTVDGVPISSPCSPCGGTGKVPDGWVDVGDLMDKCNDILEKCNDILDEVKTA